jgi:hypothetical protein
LHSRNRIFLLSPANLGGIRAGYVLNPSAEFELACRLRREGLPLGELFSFISGLYFRGKLAYARAFATAPTGLPGALVITASSGLVRPDTIVKIDQLREWAGNDIDASDRQYRAALDRDCGLLFERFGNSYDVVLLGSIATSKYVDPLLAVFGEQLLFPTDFVGRGDMSRGGLMLRSVEAGQELTYTPVLNAIRHGKRPAKLIPSTGRGTKPAVTRRVTPSH